MDGFGEVGRGERGRRGGNLTRRLAFLCRSQSLSWGTPLHAGGEISPRLECVQQAAVKAVKAKITRRSRHSSAAPLRTCAAKPLNVVTGAVVF